MPKPPDYPDAPPGQSTPWQALSLFLGLIDEGPDRARINNIHHMACRNLEKAAKMIVEEAQRVIGTYEYGWPPLKPATVARKEADTPLYETGALRDSIGYEVQCDQLTASVGSNDPVAVFQELGTVTIPPRSFLMGAAMHKEAEIVYMTGVDIHAMILQEIDENG